MVYDWYKMKYKRSKMPVIPGLWAYYLIKPQQPKGNHEKGVDSDGE